MVGWLVRPVRITLTPLNLTLQARVNAMGAGPIFGPAIITVNTARRKAE